MSRSIGCAQVWGGIENMQEDIQTGAIQASLYSHAADGGKGGDIYFFSVCGGDRLTRIAVADVLGHGRAVSQISEWVYDTMLGYLSNPASNEVIATLNNTVETKGFKAMTTVAMASIILHHGEMYFAYAGHPPMMVWRRKEKAWIPAEMVAEAAGCNMPLGVMQDTCYTQESLPLEPGDKVFIYTDGVVEAPAEGGGMFGEKRLLDALNEAGDGNPSQVRESVLDALNRHTGGVNDHDDVTILAVQAAG